MSLERNIPQEIQILEKRLKGYQGNYDFAVLHNNPVRQTKYANSVRETKLKIKELERDIPLESNERLREMLNKQDENIESLRAELNAEKEARKASEARIEAFINPPKVIPPEETDLQTTVPHECPDCGKTYKGARGVAAHQRSGACKKAH